MMLMSFLSSSSLTTIPFFLSSLVHWILCSVLPHLPVRRSLKQLAICSSLWWKRLVRTIFNLLYNSQPLAEFCRWPSSYKPNQSNEINVLEKNYISFPFSLNCAASWRAPWRSLYWISLQCTFFHSCSIMVSFFPPHSGPLHFSFCNYLRLKKL